MRKNFSILLAVLAATFGLASCALPAPTKKSPGSHYAVTCSSEAMSDDAACDAQARQWCDNPPVRKESTSQQTGSTYMHTVFYVCP